MTGYDLFSEWQKRTPLTKWKKLLKMIGIDPYPDIKSDPSRCEGMCGDFVPGVVPCLRKKANHTPYCEHYLRERKKRKIFLQKHKVKICGQHYDLLRVYSIVKLEKEPVIFFPDLYKVINFKSFESRDKCYKHLIRRLALQED
mgnify:CR=1 FL=1